MTEIKNLNKLHHKLATFGVRVQPRQTSRGQVTYPVHYRCGSNVAVLTCNGGQPSYEWRGKWSDTVMRRIREHFKAFIAVDSL
jgi:hypothetical protein